MLQANPALTPDVAKATLKGTAKKTNAFQFGTATGLVDAYGAAYAAAKGVYMNSPANTGLIPSTGTGSIELSRGSFHVYADLPFDGLGANDIDGQMDLVTGEIDALGNSWTNLGWSTSGWTNLGWSNLGWANTGWSSTAWTNLGWTNTGWSNTGRSGVSWTNLGWSNLGWANTGWSNTGWSNMGWSAGLWN